jgi:hypothetical protein
LGHFFHEKTLCIGLNHIFQVEVWRNFAKKRKKTEKALAQAGARC